MHVYQIKRNLHLYYFNFSLFDTNVILFFTKKNKQNNRIIFWAIRDEINNACGRGKDLEKIEMASMENCRYQVEIFLIGLSGAKK